MTELLNWLQNFADPNVLADIAIAACANVQNSIVQDSIVQDSIVQNSIVPGVLADIEAIIASGVGRQDRLSERRAAIMRLIRANNKDVLTSVILAMIRTSHPYTAIGYEQGTTLLHEAVRTRQWEVVTSIIRVSGSQTLTVVSVPEADSSPNVVMQAPIDVCDPGCYRDLATAFAQAAKHKVNIMYGPHNMHMTGERPFGCYVIDELCNWHASNAPASGCAAESVELSSVDDIMTCAKLYVIARAGNIAALKKYNNIHIFLPDIINNEDKYTEDVKIELFRIADAMSYMLYGMYVLRTLAGKLGPSENGETLRIISVILHSMPFGLMDNLKEDAIQSANHEGARRDLKNLFAEAGKNKCKADQ